MNSHQIEKSAKLLKAIANERRLKILYNIANEELSVGEIEKLFDMTQSALSQHLAILRKENIVKTRRKAQSIYYRLENQMVKDLLSFLSNQDYN